MANQTGDKKIVLYSSILGVLLAIFLFTLCITTLFLTWFIEDSELVFWTSWIGIILTLVLWFFIKRSYYKITFNDKNLSLHSIIPFATREIQYSDIIKIVVDHKSNKRRIETINEFFKIDKADKSSLEKICRQKSLTLEIINVT